MKKFTAVIVSVMCLLNLTACGNSTLEPSETQVFETVEVNASSEDINTSSEGANTSSEDANASSEDANTSSEDVTASPRKDSKTAVVYFSATGNTREVAEQIAKEINADIYEIVPAEEYTAEDLNYNNDNCSANLEMNDEAARPAIQGELSAVTDYEVIYLGYPIWWGTCPRIIQTFLESYDVSSAEVYTFCTSGSSGIDKSISDLRALYTEVNIVDGKRLSGASGDDIREWIESNTKSE